MPAVDEASSAADETLQLSCVLARFGPLQARSGEVNLLNQSGGRARRIGLVRVATLFKRTLRRLRLRALAPFSASAAAYLQAEFVPRSAGRDLQIDRSIAIPLPWANEAETRRVRIAAVVHLFYDELAIEIRRYLESVEESVDVYVSTGNQHQAELIRTAFNGWRNGSIEVRVVPNIGRDIAPKLVAFKDVYSHYEYVILLHGKRSTHASVLAPWRQFTLESLLGSKNVVTSIVTIFDNQPSIGIVAAQHFEPVRRWLGWGSNFARSQILAHRMGFNLDPRRPLDFPSGSMFWARTAALKPLLDLDLRYQDFDPEKGQQDGTLAHAVEHLFFFACEHAGYDWVKTGQPELYESTPAIDRLEEPRDLSRWLCANGYRLTAPYGKREAWSESRAVSGPSGEFFLRVRQRALGVTDGKADLGVRVAVGIPLAGPDPIQMTDAAAAVIHALDHVGLAGHRVLVGSEHRAEAAGQSGCIRYIEQTQSQSFAEKHNELMSQAFAGGATHYIALAPGVIPHRGAIEAMLTASAANFHRALVEGVPVEAKHPAPYEPLCFELPDVRADCLLIPRPAFEVLEGFDIQLSADIMGIDLGWRARARGFVLKACPTALFDDGKLQPQCSDAQALLTSVQFLLRKWRGPTWLSEHVKGLAVRLGLELPDVLAESVPAEWLPYSSFESTFVQENSC
ncbi:MAG: hypothetical protein JSS14_28850 [Proteobacteria bacterium]|nr:hypothetical protein [Pseudomonadota bacterium]